MLCNSDNTATDQINYSIHFFFQIHTLVLSSAIPWLSSKSVTIFGFPHLEATCNGVILFWKNRKTIKDISLYLFKIITTKLAIMKKKKNNQGFRYFFVAFQNNQGKINYYNETSSPSRVAYLCFEVDVCSSLNKKGSNICVSIVSSDVQGSEATLKMEIFYHHSQISKDTHWISNWTVNETFLQDNQFSTWRNEIHSKLNKKK